MGCSHFNPNHSLTTRTFRGKANLGLKTKPKTKRLVKGQNIIDLLSNVLIILFKYYKNSCR